MAVDFTPIHKRPMDVDPQKDCPLFNGRIPAEIRNTIFQYSLTEFTKTDAASTYPVSSNYTRPGYTGNRAVTTALLQTCRRAYLETFHLPATSKEHVFWHERWPLQRKSTIDEAFYFSRFTQWQLDSVREIHFFLQMYWLEGSFAKLCGEPFMQDIEKVKITIRRGDWWYNERNAPLGINPQRGSGEDVGQMYLDWKIEKNGGVVPWNPNAWGCAFGKIKSIKELEIEFETSDDKKDELMAIVERARTWKFPIKDGLVLSAEAMPVSHNTWRGPVCYWSNICPYCGQPFRCTKVDLPNKGCEERKKLRSEKKGPLAHVVSVRWKLTNSKAPY